MLAGAGGVLGALLGAAGVSLVKNLATDRRSGDFPHRVQHDDPAARQRGGHQFPRARHRHGDRSADQRHLWSSYQRSSCLERATCKRWVPAVLATTRRETRVRMALVVGQLVMATVLLVGAGLLASSFVKLASVEKGYDPSKVLVFQLVFPTEYSTTRKAETIETLLGWLRAKPDTESAGFAYAGILLGIEDTVGNFVPPGRALAEVQRDADGRSTSAQVSESWISGSGRRTSARRPSVQRGRFSDRTTRRCDQPQGCPAVFR